MCIYIDVWLNHYSAQQKLSQNCKSNRLQFFFFFFLMWLKFPFSGNSLAVQWLKLHTSIAEGTGSILGQGTKILNAKWQKKKKRFLFSSRKKISTRPFTSQSWSGVLPWLVTEVSHPHSIHRSAKCQQFPEWSIRFTLKSITLSHL